MKIVILTGAGISAESGIPTFRDSFNGLYNDYNIDEVVSKKGLEKNPELVYNFHNDFRRKIKNVKPNNAHKALVKLESKHNVTIVTQNIDDLHEKAGNSTIFHIHGQLKEAICMNCSSIFNIEYNDLSLDSKCEECSGTLRPNVVFFDEATYHSDEVFKALDCCELFVSIGTSGVVYPALTYVQIMTSYGTKTIELNLEASEMSDAFDKNIFGNATKIVPEFVDTYL